MAHDTLPANDWFARERRRVAWLLYLPIPPLPGGGEILYIFRTETRDEEEEELFADDPEDKSYVDTDSESDTSSDEQSTDLKEGDKGTLSAEEVLGLREEAGFSHAAEAMLPSVEENDAGAVAVAQPPVPKTGLQGSAVPQAQVSHLTSEVQSQDHSMSLVFVRASLVLRG